MSQKTPEMSQKTPTDSRGAEENDAKNRQLQEEAVKSAEEKTMMEGIMKEEIGARKSGEKGGFEAALKLPNLDIEAVAQAEAFTVSNIKAVTDANADADADMEAVVAKAADSATTQTGKGVLDTAGPNFIGGKAPASTATALATEKGAPEGDMVAPEGDMVAPEGDMVAPIGNRGPEVTAAPEEKRQAPAGETRAPHCGPEQPKTQM